MLSFFSVDRADMVGISSRQDCEKADSRQETGKGGETKRLDKGVASQIDAIYCLNPLHFHWLSPGASSSTSIEAFKAC